MSVITQYGYSPLILAADWGRTGAIAQLINSGANLDLQDEVCQYTLYKGVGVAMAAPLFDQTKFFHPSQL